MGCGKSSLSRRAVAKYGGTVFDTDREFTRRYGQINDFFARRGESEFRKLEEELLIEAASSGADFIATGGGAVLSRRGMYALRAKCDIAYLTAPIEELEVRIMRSDRPLKSKLREVMKVRGPLYDKYADYLVDTTDESLVSLENALKTPRKNRYDVVLSDSDDTLLDFQKARATAVRATARAMALSLKVMCSEDKFDEEYKKVVCAVWKRLERGEIDHAELEIERVKMLSDRLGFDIAPDDFNGVYIEEMKKTRFVKDGAIEFLDALKLRGVKTYIITNSFIKYAVGRLEPLRPHVDGEFVSEAVGYYKPDKRFFDAVLSELGDVDRSRVLVLGDSETSDIAGGINSGLDTCLLDPAGDKATAADYHVQGYADVLNVI